MLTFDFAMGLVKNNLLVVDRETESVWSQLDNKAISGPKEGEPMTIVPTLQTTWKFWREKHPDTKVMIVEGKKGRPYLYRNRKMGEPRPTSRPTTHDMGAIGLGLSFNGKAMYYPFRELDKTSSPFEQVIGGRKVVIHYKKDALTAWAEDTEGNLLIGVLAYETGWKDFNPQTSIFIAESTQP